MDVMPKEQFEFIKEIENYIEETTNYGSVRAKELAFEVWQNRAFFSNLLFEKKMEEELMEVERTKRRLQQLFPNDDLEVYIHPCKGCEDYCWKSDECKSNGGCGNKEIDEMFKKQRKYEWHDLRKNPNDLPKEERVRVLVKVKSRKYGDTLYDVGWFCDEWKVNNAFDIIAWKYIEEVEDEI